MLETGFLARKFLISLVSVHDHRFHLGNVQALSANGGWTLAFFHDRRLLLSASAPMLSPSYTPHYFTQFHTFITSTDWIV